MNVAVNLLKFVRNLKSAKSLRLFRITRSQRALRLLKFAKKVKWMNMVLTSAATLQRIKEILQKSWM
jgi:hypothetical protein